MLSAYTLLKPPSFGNCSVLDKSDPLKLSFDSFKTIFPKLNTENNNLKKVRDQIDLVLQNQNDDDNNCEDIISNLYDNCKVEAVNCVIYYLTGFICKKLFKSTKCTICREHLYHTSVINPNQNADARLTTLKSRGGLNHPNKVMCQFFSKIETILSKHIESVDVFDIVLEELYASDCVMNFPCNEHKAEVLSKAVYFYLIMRIKQYYKQSERDANKSCAKKRKESKLQDS